MNMYKTVIAADLGATGIKMANGCFDGKSFIVKEFLDFKNEPVLLNDNFYFDIFGLYKNILFGLNYYSKELAIDSIGIDTWGASYGLLDSDGKLMELIYHYRDRRTENTMEKMFEKTPLDEIFAITGCQPNRTYTLPQLFSYIEHKKDTLNRADKMLFLPDLIAYFLSGEMSTERSIAGTSSLLLPNQSDWAYEIFERLNIPTHFLTNIINTGSVKGNILKSLTNKNTINSKIIAAAGHDTASAIIGIPGFGKNQVYISMGTNINMGIELTNEVMTELAFDGGFKNSSIIDDRLMLYRDFSAGFFISRFIEDCLNDGNHYSFEAVMDMAAASISKGVFIDVEDTILTKPNGSLKQLIDEFLINTGQEKLNNDGEYARCIFESIAIKAAFYVNHLRYDMNIPVEKISIVNGGSRNTVLMQMISDATNNAIYCGMPYSSVIGNLMTQLYALGELGSIDEIRDVSGKTFVMREYSPNQARTNYFMEALDKFKNKEIIRR